MVVSHIYRDAQSGDAKGAPHPGVEDRGANCDMKANIAAEDVSLTREEQGSKL